MEKLHIHSEYGRLIREERWISCSNKMDSGSLPELAFHNIPKG
jgi:hypothetical protein